MVELNRSKNSKQPDRPTFYTSSTKSFYLISKRFYKARKQVVFFKIQYAYFQDMMAASEKLIQNFFASMS